MGELAFLKTRPDTLSKMPNKSYRKGVRKERKLVNEARHFGCIAFRSAGSHSPIDVCIVDSKEKTIDLIQCKYDGFPISQIEKLNKKYKDLNGDFRVRFSVI